MNKFEKILVTLFLIELFVGGGGRIIDFGFLSIRQVFFIGLILTFIFRIIKNKAYKDHSVNTFIRWNPVSIGVYVLMGWFFVSAVIGYANGNAPSIIAMDFLRVAFFAAYFPLAYYVSEERFTKARIIAMLKYCAFGVAVFTIVLALLGKTIFSGNFDAFQHFWKSIMNDDLLFRRSHSVFYKSHFYVFVGLVLSLNAVLSKKFGKIDVLNIIFCSISIFWSDTRGFSIALMVSLLMILIIDIKIITDPIKGFAAKFHSFFNHSQLIKKTIILLLITISVPFLYQYMTSVRFDPETISDNKSEFNDPSVNVRLEFMKEAKDTLLNNPNYLIFGTGYGEEIAGRVTGLEMSFLDILVEQGAIGLAAWLYLCFIVIWNYYKGYKRSSELHTDDISLIGVFVGVILLTNINPFLNNPIGIVFFLLVLIFSQQWKNRDNI